MQASLNIEEILRSSGKLNSSSFFLMDNRYQSILKNKILAALLRWKLQTTNNHEFSRYILT